MRTKDAAEAHRRRARRPAQLRSSTQPLFVAHGNKVGAIEGLVLLGGCSNYCMVNSLPGIKSASCRLGVSGIASFAAAEHMPPALPLVDRVAIHRPGPPALLCGHWLCVMASPGFEAG